MLSNIQYITLNNNQEKYGKRVKYVITKLIHHGNHVSTCAADYWEWKETSSPLHYNNNFKLMLFNTSH